MKTAQENIDLQTTILSRFDLIFIVKDERSMDRDKQIARHVLNVHKNAGAALEVDEEEKKVSGQAQSASCCCIDFQMYCDRLRKCLAVGEVQGTQLHCFLRCSLRCLHKALHWLDILSTPSTTTATVSNRQSASA
jgi:hypothetical protein